MGSSIIEPATSPVTPNDSDIAQAVAPLYRKIAQLDQAARSEPPTTFSAFDPTPSATIASLQQGVGPSVTLNITQDRQLVQLYAMADIAGSGGTGYAVVGILGGDEFGASNNTQYVTYATCPGVVVSGASFSQPTGMIVNGTVVHENAGMWTFPLNAGTRTFTMSLRATGAGQAFSQNRYLYARLL